MVHRLERNLGGVDTNRAGWYFSKKTGMVKFVEIGKKGKIILYSLKKVC